MKRTWSTAGPGASGRSKTNRDLLAVGVEIGVGVEALAVAGLEPDLVDLELRRVAHHAVGRLGGSSTSMATSPRNVAAARSGAIVSA